MANNNKDRDIQDVNRTKRAMDQDEYAFSDATDVLQQQAGLQLEFYHIASKTSAKFKSFSFKIRDRYEPKWTEDDVYGRNDPLATFQNTKRTISVSWRVAAYSLREAVQNVVELEKLARMTYPSYDSVTAGASAINGSPLIKVKFLNLAWSADKRGKTSNYEFISSAATSGLVAKLGPFDIAPLFEYGTFQHPETHGLYPKIVDMTVEMTIFHTHPLGWQGNSFRAVGFPYGEVLRGDGVRKVSNKPKPTNNEGDAVMSVGRKEEAANQQDILGPGGFQDSFEYRKIAW